MSESPINIQSGGARVGAVNNPGNYGEVDIFNASTADYIATSILMLIGAIIYLLVKYSKIFEPARKWFTEWKHKLIVNTFMKDSETIHSSYKAPTTLFQRTIQFLFPFDDNTPNTEMAPISDLD